MLTLTLTLTLSEGEGQGEAEASLYFPLSLFGSRVVRNASNLYNKFVISTGP